jgi:ribosomal protein S20
VPWLCCTRATRVVTGCRNPTGIFDQSAHVTFPCSSVFTRTRKHSGTYLGVGRSVVLFGKNPIRQLREKTRLSRWRTLVKRVEDHFFRDDAALKCRVTSRQRGVINSARESILVKKNGFVNRQSCRILSALPHIVDLIIVNIRWKYYKTYSVHVLDSCTIIRYDSSIYRIITWKYIVLLVLDSFKLSKIICGMCLLNTNFFRAE